MKKDKENELFGDVRHLYKNFDAVRVYHARNFSNSVENWRMYSGKNPDAGLGQYDSRTVTDLLQQGRQIVTYNMIMPTMKPLMDNISKALGIKGNFEVKFGPLHLKLGKFIQSIIQLIIASITVIILSKLV